MAIYDYTYVGGIPTGNVVIRGKYRPGTGWPVTTDSVSVQITKISSTKIKFTSV